MNQGKTYLAIDCAREYCSVALAQGESVTLKEERAPKKAAKTLLTMVDSLLNESVCSPENLDFIAVTHGPGSFTGLRIACSMVQAMAFVYSIPVVPLSTLHVMAQAHFLAHGHTHTLAILNAHREEVYWGGYSVLNGKHYLGVVKPDELTKPENIFFPSSDPWEVVGDSCLLPKTLVLSSVGYYNATHLMTLAKVAFHEGLSLSAERLAPLYLRNENAWS